MSAFVCSPEHIAVLATKIANLYRLDPGMTADAIARLNISSVNHRYNETGKPEEVNHFAQHCADLTKTEPIQADADSLPWQRWIGIADCSLYQSCEDPNLLQTETYRLLERFQKRAVQETLQAHGIETGWQYV